MNWGPWGGGNQPTGLKFLYYIDEREKASKKKGKMKKKKILKWKVSHCKQYIGACEPQNP